MVITNVEQIIIIIPGLGHTYIRIVWRVPRYSYEHIILYIAATTSSKRSLAVYILYMALQCV